MELPSDSVNKLKQEFDTAAPKEIQHGDLPLSESSRSLLAEAGRLAESDRLEPDELYLLLAMSSSNGPLRDKLLAVGITREKIEHVLKDPK